MALKKRISYQWQLFIPLVLTLWGVLFGMAYYQYYNEREYRKNEIKEQLSLINARVIAAATTETDPVPFLDFVADYYIKNPLYDRIRITVYENGAMLKTYGEPIGLNEEEIRNSRVLQLHPASMSTKTTTTTTRSIFTTSATKAPTAAM